MFRRGVTEYYNRMVGRRLIFDIFLVEILLNYHTQKS